jgi:hypothetical protein
MIDSTTRPRGAVIWTNVRGSDDVLTFGEALYITDMIRQNVHAGWEFYREAFERRADVVLGYQSFDLYRVGEFSECQFTVPRESRPAVCKSLHEHGMSIRAIAFRVGCDKNTVMSDLRKLGEVSEIHTPEKITGLDGKQHPSKKPSTRRKVTLADKINKQFSYAQQAVLNLKQLSKLIPFDEQRDELASQCVENAEWLGNISDDWLRQLLDYTVVDDTVADDTVVDDTVVDDTVVDDVKKAS